MKHLFLIIVLLSMPAQIVGSSKDISIKVEEKPEQKQSDESAQLLHDKTPLYKKIYHCFTTPNQSDALNLKLGLTCSCATITTLVAVFIYAVVMQWQ